MGWRLEVAIPADDMMTRHFLHASKLPSPAGLFPFSLFQVPPIPSCISRLFLQATPTELLPSESMQWGLFNNFPNLFHSYCFLPFPLGFLSGKYSFDLRLWKKDISTRLSNLRWQLDAQQTFPACNVGTPSPTAGAFLANINTNTNTNTIISQLERQIQIQKNYHGNLMPYHGHKRAKIKSYLSSWFSLYLKTSG